jgi:preprotein translocase subunit SecD
MNKLAILGVGLFVLFLLLLAGSIGVGIWTTWGGSFTRPVTKTLVYEIEPDLTVDSPASRADIEEVVAAVDRRLNPGFRPSAKVSKLDDRRLEIGVYSGEADARRIELLMSSMGTIEFRILATRQRDQRWIDAANKLRERQSDVFDADGNLKAWWVPVAEDAQTEFRGDPGIATREGMYQGKKRLEVLVMKDADNVTGKYLIRAGKDMDEKGNLAVHFCLTSEGGHLFAHLTGRHLPDEVGNFKYRLGIILDGAMRSAPNIQSQISDRGQITGHFDEETVDRYVQVLNAGSLPVSLRKVEAGEEK